MSVAAAGAGAFVESALAAGARFCWSLAGGALGALVTLSLGADALADGEGFADVSAAEAEDALAFAASALATGEALVCASVAAGALGAFAAPFDECPGSAAGVVAGAFDATSPPTDGPFALPFPRCAASSVLAGLFACPFAGWPGSSAAATAPLDAPFADGETSSGLAAFAVFALLPGPPSTAVALAPSGAPPAFLSLPFAVASPFAARAFALSRDFPGDASPWDATLTPSSVAPFARRAP